MCTALQQPPDVVYGMAWPDALDLLDYWREHPPAHVSLHCLAVGMGTMRQPGTGPGDIAAMDAELGE